MLRRAGRAAGQVFYGMTTFDWVRDLRRGRAEAESLFLLLAFGELIGLPLLPPYYSLRLLPCPAWAPKHPCGRAEPTRSPDRRAE
jgi:hypothetical protein